MNEQIKTNIASKKVNVPLVDVQLKRNVNGTHLNIKSEIFENFFKSNGISNDRVIIGAGKTGEFYKMNNINDSAIANQLFNASNSLLNCDGYSNMSFLRMKGIDEGLSIHLAGIYNKQALKRYIEDLKNFVQDFYKKYMTTTTTKLLIQFEVENQ